MLPVDGLYAPIGKRTNLFEHDPRTEGISNIFLSFVHGPLRPVVSFMIITRGANYRYPSVKLVVVDEAGLLTFGATKEGKALMVRSYNVRPK